MGPLGDDSPPPNHHEIVGDRLDLVKQARREQDGTAAARVATEQVTHPADARRIEAIRRLVEDEDPRIARQCCGDPESLAHPERVVAHPGDALRPRSS